ncbi:MAG: UDP-N-acetylmuramate dehydrogenase [Acidimicrobiia bacterium]
MNLDAYFAQLQAVLPGRVEAHVPAASFTTYRLGGPIAVLARVASVGELTAIAAVGLPEQMLVIGRGSNLLVADRGFLGLVVVLDGEFEAIHIEGERVVAGGAVPLPVLARRVAAAGLGGLEFYVGIPGSVGGAVRMNAGGHGATTAEVLEAATVIDLAAGTDAAATPRGADALEFGYRHSNLAASAVVTQATFRGVPDDPDAVNARLEEIVRWRRTHQPGGANAGSVFRNPPDDSSGRLIEAAGAKGLRVGGAAVSEKHANFIQAEAGATAQDVCDLVRAVQARVRDAFGIDLETEIHFVGFGGGDDGVGGVTA